MRGGRPPKLCGGQVRNGGGFVALVGAGPGDPGLLTLRAKEVLEACDVVVYDHLVHPKILEYVSPKAERIYAGKKGGDPDSTPQGSIEHLLVRLAHKGKKIVRLKGGDPFVFGRGGEEALFLAKHRIPFEIVPGVTAGVGASAYAGIPVTHRGLASEVTFLTAHEDPAKTGSDLNWKALAALKGTLVFYMGVRTLPDAIQALIRHGKNPDTPVSVIEWGSTAQQRVVSGTLRTIAQKVKNQKISAPALTVIGEVNRLRQRLNWFERKPLFGKTILVTRSRSQASGLSKLLAQEGARVIELPTIHITPIQNFRLLDEAISRIERFDWLVFTSENGVEAFFKRLRQLKKDARCLSASQIAAIGPGTRFGLSHYSIEPDLVPEIFSSEGLLHAFKRESIASKRFLLLRTNIAPDFLRQELTKLGAEVTEIPVYQTEKPEGIERKIKELMKKETIDYITFTSASTAEHFFKSLSNGTCPRAKLISIGPVTSAAIRKAKIQVNREARVHTIPGLVEAVLEEATRK